MNGREEFDEAVELVKPLAFRLSPKNAAVEVNLVGERTMAELNRRYRNRKGAAEILTFPYGNEPGVDTGCESSFGEIYLCGRSIERGARKREVSSTVYMARLIIHGLLHLTGRRHDSGDRERGMEVLEKKYLHELLSEDEVERLFA